MNKNQVACRWVSLFITIGVLSLTLAGCGGGDDGAPGPAGPPGPGVAPLASSTALNIEITGVTINSAPVVSFTVTNQDGVAVAGFGDSDLRFNIAKLVPGSNGAPSKWQNYINSSSGSRPAYGSQERASTGGTLVDNRNGTFIYTFATDITNVTCPGPCTEVDGVTPLDVSYQPGLVHRVTIQQGNSSYPRANVAYDFIPAGGAVTNAREIVKTETCNGCHNELRLHGSRVETKLCVTCHNPGTWDTSGAAPQTADFKVMIHKIHMGEELPSVNDTMNPTPYVIGGHDYSTVVFPYSAVALGDTRACTKCHDGAMTAQGDNWKTQPSKAACSACHDNVYFGTLPDANKPYEIESHIDLAANHTPPVTVGPDPTDDMCITCHGEGEVADVVVAHDLPNLLKAEGEKYVFNIRTVTQTGQNGSPIITFSVDDPNDVPYDMTAFTGASLSMLIGWNNVDENNAGNGKDLAQPISVTVTGCSGTGLTYDVGTNICTITAANLTTPFTIPATVEGSGRVAIYGRLSVDVDGDGNADRVRVKAAFKDFAITDTDPVARRQVVDINKCDVCHDQVSLHGDSRTNEPGLCVICHNPNATDISRRPRSTLPPNPPAVDPGPCLGEAGALANAVNCDPTTGGSLDSKKEEAIDFKRLIHGIHAAAATDYNGDVAHGFREKGLVVYGYFSSAATAYNPVDFSHVRFPGHLNDCLTCHLPGTYELTGRWEEPTVSGVLSSSINTAPLSTDSFASPDDDLNISPTAAVCSACHDGNVAKSHMTLNGAVFSDTQANITADSASGVKLEACAICHGPGRIADVAVVHGVE